uniref:Uncharacterized protein n=1 Tax=Echinococcus canadensis TaxID=519352 RepID=A0A915EUX2_9CEST
QDRGGVTAAFEKDDFEAPNVQINFAQHDLACKQRALEHLEQRCLEAVAVEERRRFAELSTCLNPLLYLKPIHYLISPLFLEVAGKNCFPLSSQAQSAPLAALPVGMIIAESTFLPVWWLLNSCSPKLALSLHGWPLHLCINVLFLLYTNICRPYGYILSWV